MFNKLYKAKMILFMIITLAVFTVACSSKDIILEGLEEEKPIEIEFWYGLSGYLEEVMEDFILEFNNSQSEIVVRGVPQSSYEETGQALQAAIAERNTPAVVLLEDYVMHKIARHKGLAPLDDYIKLDKAFNKEDFIKPFIEQGKFDGKTYALPIFGTTQILYYRKDLFKKEGISPDALNTWEGLAEAAKKLTKRSGDEVLVYGWEPMQGRENLIDAAISRGGKFLSEDGKTVLIDSDEWVESWEAFRKWIHVDKIMKIHYGGEGWQYWYATIDDVMQGRTAGYTGSSGDQGDLDFSIIGTHIQPAWEGYENNPRAVANAHAICIPAIASKEQKLAAFKWMTYMTSPEISAKWSMETGYIPVRKSSKDIEAYKKFLKKNPNYNTPSKQASMSTSIFLDPTGGKIFDALKVAAEKVELLNIPAKQALKDAKNEAQSALDKVLENQ